MGRFIDGGGDIEDEVLTTGSGLEIFDFVK